MRHRRETGYKVPRAWAILILVVGAIIGTAFWIGPFRPLPPELRLVALGGDGQFREIVGIPSTWADTAPPQPDVPARFPLVLAVHNQGARAAAPTRVALSVPGKFRIANTAGQAYEAQSTIGNPLVRYVFDVQTGRVEPGQVPRVLSMLDTLWLEPVLPSYYCGALADSVPEFMPAPPHDAQALSQVRIFYSFDARVRDRQTGLLTVNVEPSLLEKSPAPTPPTFATRIELPKYPMPEMANLRRAGDRTTTCGDPGSAIELHSVLWETVDGGRFFVLYNGGVPRKYLFDLNRDSIIELEMWDQDANGEFEAGRQARMLIPEFVMPARPVLTAANAAEAAGSGSSTTGFEYPPALFSDTDGGPLRFWRAVSATSDSAATAPAAAPTPPPTTAPTAPAAAAPTTALPPSGNARPIIPDTGFRFPPAVFHNTDGGPLRFWRAQQRALGDTSAAVRERARPRTEPRLLGRPVPFPTPRRDTTELHRE
jgi:hypothetical protein